MFFIRSYLYGNDRGRFVPDDTGVVSWKYLGGVLLVSGKRIDKVNIVPVSSFERDCDT